MSPNIESSGQLRLNVNSTGTAANPNMQGQIEIVNANFAGGDLPSVCRMGTACSG